MAVKSLLAALGLIISVFIIIAMIINVGLMLLREFPPLSLEAVLIIIMVTVLTVVLVFMLLVIIAIILSVREYERVATHYYRRL